MPWAAADATKHTKKADTPKRQRMWADVANSEMVAGKPESVCIRAANSAVARDHAKQK